MNQRVNFIMNNPNITQAEITAEVMLEEENRAKRLDPKNIGFRTFLRNGQFRTPKIAIPSTPPPIQPGTMTVPLYAPVDNDFEKHVLIKRFLFFADPLVLRNPPAIPFPLFPFSTRLVFTTAPSSPPTSIMSRRNHLGNTQSTQVI
jgi:hypothetical protein